MLSVLRGLVTSKVGAVVAVVFLGLLALAMVSGDVSSWGQGAGAGGGGDVMKVGKTRVTAAELRTRVTQEMEAFRQQQPTLTMEQFVSGGGFDATVERLANSLALEEFGRRQGLVVSKRLVDGRIASIPGLQGPNGQFDPNLFRQLLADRKLTEAGVRADLRRDLVGRLLTERLLQPVAAPAQLAVPYANLSLEKRAGEIALVPTSAVSAGPAPTDAEVQAFYSRNLARYTVPERRVIRYARVTPEQVRARAVPTEAEIAQVYKQDAAKYAPAERRSVTRVVVLDQAGANALAAKVRGGQSLADAARGAGLDAATESDVDKATLAQRTSPAVADAVFAASRGALVGPVRGGIGFVVARVDAVRAVPGRTLDQAREEIAAALTAQKTVDAISTLQGAIDDRLAEDATFDEVVADQKLAAQSTLPLLANGTNPEQPGAAPDATLAPLVSTAFGMHEGDEPQLVSTGTDGSFAVVALGRVLPAAPRPLAEIRPVVARDLAADRARQAARRVAAQMLAAINKGQSFAAAWAATGLRTDAPKPLAASREDVDRAQGPSRAPLALMFAMAPGAVRLLEAPGGAGWAVIRLNTIIPGDASRDQARIEGVRQAFGQVLSREYLQQFARAARAAVGVDLNRAAIARVRAELVGQ